MWIKILKYVVVAAKATGLDSKIANWVKGRLKKAGKKAVDAANAKFDQIDEVQNLMDHK